MRRTGPRGASAPRPGALTAIGVALAGLVLASCSGAGSGGSRPTLSVSGSAGSSRTSGASRTASAEAPTRSAGIALPGASATSSGGSTTATTPATTTSGPTRTATNTRTQPAPVTTTTTTTATAAPTTATTTVTKSAPAPVASVAPTTASPATAPVTETSGAVPWWAWALLLLAVAGVVTGIVVIQGRRRRAAEAWDRGLSDARTAALWLHDRVLPTVLADRGPTATATAWPAARPRLLELDEQLTTLGRTAPDEERRSAAVTLRTALADAAGALDRRAAALDAQARVGAQTQAELADERLGHLLAYDALLPTAPGRLPPAQRAASGPPPSPARPSSHPPPSGSAAPDLPPAGPAGSDSTPPDSPSPDLPPPAPPGSGQPRTGGRHALPDE